MQIKSEEEGVCPAHSPLPAVPCSRDATWQHVAMGSPCSAFNLANRSLQTCLNRVVSANAATVTFLLSSSLSSEQKSAECRAQNEVMSELQSSLFF